VAPLVFVNLQKNADLYAQIPDAVRTEYTTALLQNKVVKQKRARELDRVLSLCDGLDLDVMLIKGAALDAVVFEHPWYTVSADIDIVIRARKGESPPGKLAAIAWDIECSGPFECEALKHHDVDLCGVLKIDFTRIWQEAVKLDLRGKTVLVMSPEDMLLAACINSSRRRFVRLKNMLDISEAARRVSGDGWETFVKRANAADCQNIVYAAIRAVKQALGCEIPDGALRGLKIRRWRAGVIDRVIQGALSFSFDQLDAGVKIFWKRVNISLVLPYTTYRAYQLWGILTRTLRSRMLLSKDFLSKALSRKKEKERGATAHPRLGNSG
jgi:hypothetical protein